MSSLPLDNLSQLPPPEPVAATRSERVGEEPVDTSFQDHLDQLDDEQNDIDHTTNDAQSPQPDTDDDTPKKDKTVLADLSQVLVFLNGET